VLAKSTSFPEEVTPVDALYFALSILGGFFIIAIPWSGMLLIMAKREPKPEATNPNS